MKRIDLVDCDDIIDDEPIDYPEDCDRIVRIFKERGYEVTAKEAEAMWQAYSAELCAGWMILPGQDDLWSTWKGGDRLTADDYIFDRVRPFFRDAD